MAWEKRAYNRVMKVLSSPVGSRGIMEMEQLEPWFKKKSGVLSHLTRETLLDVIQHCEFVTRQPDDVIIHQGEKGHRFYIILRGNVSIVHKDSLEDVDLGEEGAPRFVDRSSLGNELVRFGEGSTFGEIALINPDCIRTASVVANEKTDLVVIHRDLYNRSVSKVIAREYAEKMDFIESVPLFKDWLPKFKKHLAASLKKESFPFECPIVKQGDQAQDMYFIVSGEVKLQVDPEAHQEQFQKFINKYEDESDLDCENEKAYFPTKFLPQIEKFSRVSKTQQLHRSSEEQVDLRRSLPKSWSPSAIRHMNQRIKAKKVQLNLCYLGEKQYFGDVEFLMGLNKYHASAICSRETTVMTLFQSHYDRLFKRRNPQSIKNMARTVELQLSRRILKPNIMDSVPLLKCFVYRLQELKRESGKKLQILNNGNNHYNHFDIEGVTYEDVNEMKSKEDMEKMKSYTWSESFKQSETNQPFRPKPIQYAKRLPYVYSPKARKPQESILSPKLCRSPRSTSNGSRKMEKHAFGHPNKEPGSPDMVHISMDSYRTFGSGFKSINGKGLASSYDHDSRYHKKQELPPVDFDFDHHFVKHKGDFMLEPIVNYHTA